MERATIRVTHGGRCSLHRKNQEVALLGHAGPAKTADEKTALRGDSSAREAAAERRPEARAARTFKSRVRLPGFER
jgi:hypothetical protein